MTTPARPELVTARLRLRPVCAADVDALHAHWTLPEVRRFLWDDVVIDRATAAERVAGSEASFAASGFGLWALLEPQAQATPLGVVGLVVIDPAVGPEILYSLDPERWGRGHATEAGRAVLAYAFETLGLARVAGRTDAPNRASARVLERLGMRAEGERLVNGNPHACYALERADWLRARAASRC